MGTNLEALLSEVARNTGSSIAACRAGAGSGVLGAGMRSWGATSEMGLERWVSWRRWGNKAEAGRREHDCSGRGSRCTERAGVQGYMTPKDRVINEAGGGPRWLSLIESPESVEQGSEGKWTMPLEDLKLHIHILVPCVTFGTSPDLSEFVSSSDTWE